MKKLLFTIITAIFLGLASYAIFGFITKQSITSGLEGNMPSLASPPQTMVEQGLFSSSANIVFNIPLPEEGSGGVSELPIVLEQKIYHGPFIFQKTTSGPSPLNPVKMYSEGSIAIGPFLDPEPPEVKELRELITANISVLMPLSGPTVIKANGLPFINSNTFANDTVILNWQGFDSEVATTTTPLSYNISGQAPGFTLNINGIDTVSIADISLQGAFAEGPHEIALGSSELGIDLIEISPADNEQVIKISAAKTILSITEDHDLLSIKETIKIEKIEVNKKQYGPAQFELAINNLDAATVASLENEIKAIQETEKDPEIANQQMMQLFMEKGPTLLKASPEIELSNVSFKGPNGQLQASAKLAFDGQGEVMLNPFFIMGRTTVTGNISADQHLVAAIHKEALKAKMCTDQQDRVCDQQAAKISSDQLKDLIERQTIVLTKGKFTIDFSFKDGIMLVNDKPWQGPLF